VSVASVAACDAELQLRESAGIFSQLQASYVALCTPVLNLNTVIIGQPDPTLCITSPCCPADSFADMQLQVNYPGLAQKSFPVNGVILRQYCPQLAALAAAGADTIIVKDIEPDVAQAMLHAIYTGTMFRWQC
jgi:hypothetical protein